MPPSRDAVLIGYFPKCIMPRPDWLKAPNVVDIYSVSGCMSPEPEGWIEHWRHNEMCVYDSPELAWGIVQNLPDSESFKVLAYRILPLRFVDGNAEPLVLPPLGVQALPDNFRFFGFDAVSLSQGPDQAPTFQHSPLSCNGIAETEPVNRHCLMDEEETALRLARAFSDQSMACEPGAYCVVEVWCREE